LQSGTSIGAIITPLIMSAMLTGDLASWRMPFQVVGAAGFVWVICWFAMVRSGDLTTAPVDSKTTAITPLRTNLWRLFLSRRMLVLFFVVACINTCWQTLRAWLPKFLQQGRGYAETEMLYFNS